MSLCQHFFRGVRGREISRPFCRSSPSILLALRSRRSSAESRAREDRELELAEGELEGGLEVSARGDAGEVDPELGHGARDPGADSRNDGSGAEKPSRLSGANKVSGDVAVDGRDAGHVDDHSRGAVLGDAGEHALEELLGAGSVDAADEGEDEDTFINGENGGREALDDGDLLVEHFPVGLDGACEGGGSGRLAVLEQALDGGEPLFEGREMGVKEVLQGRLAGVEGLLEVVDIESLVEAGQRAFGEEGVEGARGSSVFGDVADEHLEAGADAFVALFAGEGAVAVAGGLEKLLADVGDDGVEVGAEEGCDVGHGVAAPARGLLAEGRGLCVDAAGFSRKRETIPASYLE